MIVINRNPTRKQLRQFSAIGFVFLLILGSAAIYWDRQLLGGIAWVFSILFGIGMLSRSWARITYAFTMFVTYPIGFVLSYAILGIIYYVVITPTAVISRLFGRDPLALKRDLARTTYWVSLSHEKKPSDYYRQF